MQRSRYCLRAYFIIVGNALGNSQRVGDGTVKLTDGGQGILVDGDEATGAVDSGNKITVSASQQKLAT